MIRFFVFLAFVAALAFGLYWVMERPGSVELTWLGYHIKTSPVIGLAAILALAVAIGLAWTVLRFIFRIPSLLSYASSARRRSKGLAALSRGMVAAGAGDARTAQRAADEALRFMPSEPLSLLLKAQAAQLGGDKDAASRAFSKMLEKPETRLLGLRGLHIEAKRRGDDDAAHDYAREAHRITPVPWAGQAVLEHKTAQADWQGALAAIDANVASRTLDRKAAARQRAVLQTAIAQEKAGREPEAALSLVREALKAAPDLVPAAVLAGRMLARKGDLRRAAKTLELAWTASPHPDIARAYLDVRPGDSTSDRLARARNLARMNTVDPESAMMLARAALDARDFGAAREALRPLADGENRPTARVCLLMAQLEETEKGTAGPVREWLARASRAPRDKAWVADGVISDTWSPVSPVTGQIDAFQWRAPNEQLSAHLVEWQPAEMPAVQEVIEAEVMPEPLRISAPQEPAVQAAAMSAATGTDAPATRPATTPVIFPRPNAPDDPGTRDERAKPRFGFLPRD